MFVLKLIPLLTIFILMITAFIVPIIKEKKYVYRVGILSFLFVFILSLFNLFNVINIGGFIFTIGHFSAPFGIVFKIDYIESIISLLFSFVMLMVIWYSRYSLEKEIKENKVKYFYTLSLLLLASLLGIVYTYDIFNGFVFLEVSTLSAAGIIIAKDKKENIKSAMKYLILSTLGSGLILMSIAFIYSITGHLSMEYIHSELILKATSNQDIILISLILFTVGLGIKGAMFPLHIWLPDAHSSAPSPSSAILSALVIKAPIIFMLKIFYMAYGFDIVSSTNIFNLILIFGSLGMILGSLFARRQTEIKRMIAYSSVAQMGYIFFAIGLGNELGFLMAIYHIIAHAVTKSSLFLAVGSIIEQSGFKKIDEIRGIGKEMPVTLAIFSVSAFSMIGIPVLPGFISKWNLSLASISSGKYYLLGIILLSSLLNAAYYFPIIINGYFGEDNLDGKVFKSKSKPIKELVPLIVLTLVMIITGFYSGKIIELIKLGSYFN